MRIAMVSKLVSAPVTADGSGAGGQTRHVTGLAASLAELGHDVRIYTRRESPDPPETHRLPSGVEVVTVTAGPAEPASEEALLRLSKPFGEGLAAAWAGDDWAPDLIHAHYWTGGLAAMVASRQRPVPVALTYHELGAIKRRFLGDRYTSPACRIGMERELGRAADCVISQCEAETQELLRLGVPRGRIVTVPSGVDPTRFAPSDLSAADRGDPARIIAVGTAGRFSERKGLVDAIRALRLVPHAEMVIVGGPPTGELDRDPQARQLRAVAESSGVSDRVRLVGAVPLAEMPTWYRSADLLACSSWYEPFGITAVEGMASGVPVVATSVGGFPDTVVDGLTGVLVPPQNPTALGRAMRGVLTNPMRRMAYATAGLDRARQCYAWDRIAVRCAGVYGRLRAETAAA
jgi:glycosyltransferase involved in cell wall biosynthesis